MDHTAKLWDAQSGEMVRSYDGHQGRVHSAAFSHDGARIVTASADKTTRIKNNLSFPI